MYLYSQYMLFIFVHIFIFCLTLISIDIIIFNIKDKHIVNNAWALFISFILLFFSFFILLIFPFSVENYGISHKDTYVLSVIDNDTSVVFVSPDNYTKTYKYINVDSTFRYNLINSDGILWQNEISPFGLIFNRRILFLNNNQYNYYKSFLKEHK